MPAQKRLRPHSKDVPRPVRQHPAKRREQHPIVKLEARLSHLPAKNRQLVPEHKNLHLLRPLAAPDEDE
jgi:hypothetical protein